MKKSSSSRQNRKPKVKGNAHNNPSRLEWIWGIEPVATAY
jgi:hypothetical protein